MQKGNLQLTATDTMSVAVKERRAKSYDDVFRKEIVAEGAVVKVDLVESLFGQLHHVTLVVSAVFVLADHLLSHRELVHGRFISLFVAKTSEHSHFCSWDLLHSRWRRTRVADCNQRRRLRLLEKHRGQEIMTLSFCIYSNSIIHVY